MASFLLRSALLAASVTQAVASCAYNTHIHPREEGGEIKVGTFGYTGEIGPLNWVALDVNLNGVCATGTRQSPIDMVPGVFNMIAASDLSLEIPDFLEGTEFENLGTTVEVIAKGGTLVVGGITYQLQQFHFHLPSEHLDEGTSLAMEMHMVWQSAANEIAVIGVFVDLEMGVVSAAAPAAVVPLAEAPAAAKQRRRHGRDIHVSAAEVEQRAVPGPESPLLSAVAPGVAIMATNQAAVVPPTSSVLLETVLPFVDAIRVPGTATKTPPLIMSELVNTLKLGGFKSYSGSLTTPPCSEGVRWLVATQKLKIAPATFDKVRSVIGFNARYPQNAPGQSNLLQVSNIGIAQIPVAAPVVAPAAE